MVFLLVGASHTVTPAGTWRETADVLLPRHTASPSLVSMSARPPTPLRREKQSRMLRIVALFLGLAAVGAVSHGAAQPVRGIPRLCFLTLDPGSVRENRFRPFFQHLEELGYVDGRTIAIDYLSAAGR